MKPDKSYAAQVYYLLKLYGMSDQIASYFTALASFETASFTSNVFHENNNPFGYKYVGQSLAIGENRGHASYSDISMACREIVSYWARRRLRRPLPLVFGSLRDFVEYLGDSSISPGRYFEVSNDHYYRGVLVHYENLFS